MSLVSYSELYLDQGASSVTFGTGTVDDVSQRQRSHPHICCYAKVSKDSGHLLIRQGLATWDDIAGVFFRLERNPLVDNGVSLSFYQEASALMKLAKNYVDAGKVFPSTGRWVVFTLDDSRVFPISRDDVWISLNDTDGRRRVYMEIHGSHDEIAPLLREIQESLDTSTSE